MPFPWGRQETLCAQLLTTPALVGLAQAALGLPPIITRVSQVIPETSIWEWLEMVGRARVSPMASKDPLSRHRTERPACTCRSTHASAEWKSSPLFGHRSRLSESCSDSRFLVCGHFPFFPRVGHCSFLSLAAATESGLGEADPLSNNQEPFSPRDSVNCGHSRVHLMVHQLHTLSCLLWYPELQGTQEFL